VPGGIAAPRPLVRPVLAVGAHLKNTFALGAGGTITLGPHVGDLENLEAYAALEGMVARMERFLGVRPEVIACDLHPGYLSTRYARERAQDIGARLVPVQHHHAHVASAMAEHGLTGEVLGLAWDGTGLGPDGASWGGELLLATYAGFRRLATFRPIPLAGSDRAVREPWRTALALADDAFDGAPPLADLPVLAARAPAEIALVRRMIAAGLNTPRAHGVGRYFDAVAALSLGRPLSAYEGQLPAALEWAADPGIGEAYPFELDLEAEPWQVDLRPLVRAAVADLVAGCGAPIVAARFHEALAAAAAALLAEAVQRLGPRPIVLGGGCFQNARLVEAILRRVGVPVYLPRRVPAGDGGLALGQAVVADAVIRDGG
jgi:hydrogenase maturation protein HypF